MPLDFTVVGHNLECVNLATVVMHINRVNFFAALLNAVPDRV
jgi:hypothetical protein